jgi:hypothetical protein
MVVVGYARPHPGARIPEAHTYTSCERSGDHPLMDTFPDLGSLSEAELKDLIRELTDEETDISYKRRILHGKIDILRAELVNRMRKKHDGGEQLITGEDVQQLTDILARRQSGNGTDG